MSVYEIVKLVGTCVGLILGAIVSFVLFFRVMAWIDLWVKYKTGAERSRPKVKSKKSRIGPGDSTPQQSDESKSHSSTMPQLIHDRSGHSQHQNRVVREQLANRQPRPYNRSNDATPACEVSTAYLEGSEQRSKALDIVAVSEPETKTSNRIATVQLLSGETIERVSFCSKEKAAKICEGLGFTGIVLENDEGQISVIRESNIKLVTWKVC
jgi:hypothetical protein